MPLSEPGVPEGETGALRPASIWGRVRAHMARYRDRLYSSPGFQEFAVRFPLTRGVSNAYARRLFDLAVGFSYARVLHACVVLDLFAMLKDGPESIAALASRCAMPLDGMTTLVRAAASLDLLRMHGAQSVRLGPFGAALLGNPGVEAMIAHHSLLYRDLADPIALLRGQAFPTEVQRFWPYGDDADPAGVAAYSRLMAATQAMIARLILAAYPMRRRRLLLDVGGGEGAFLIHAARAAPELRVRLVDRPAVAERARQRFVEAGLGDRAEAVGADARVDRLPEGADTVSFVRVLHDHDDAEALALLRAASAALAPGGVVLIAEPMAETRGARAMGDAYFGLYLTAMGQGRPRSRLHLSQMLRQAGFVGVEERRTAQPVLVRLLVARKAT